MINYRNPLIEFSGHDRCDSCRARAYARAERDGLELMFCAHHIKKHNYALELDGWSVTCDAAGLAELSPDYDKELV